MIDISGSTFGRLKVIERAENKGRAVRWLCKCVCGQEKIIMSGHLKSGKIKSCGCLRLESVTKAKKTHGKTNSVEYKAWQSMKNRCYNNNYFLYENYGGRGISVCDRWLDSFESFYEDMGDRPKGSQIDRIDNNGNYTPENCRWISPCGNSRNRKTSRYWYVYGVKYDAAIDAAKEHGVVISTIRTWCLGRYDSGLSKEPRKNCWSELKY